MFPQAGLFFASASACEGVRDAAGPVLLEDKAGSLGSKFGQVLFTSVLSPDTFVCVSLPVVY